MKKLELDLREVNGEVVGESWSDNPARAWLEDAILDFAGKVVVVRITEKRETEVKDNG